MADRYPGDFIRHFFSVDTSDVSILKTELTIEPIRADSVAFIQTGNRIAHLEFETLPKSERTPIPLRVLDYYTRLKRQYNCEIQQLVIFLKETSSPLVFENQYRDTNTEHRYEIIRLWEQDPAPFLANRGLLPLAPLTRSENPPTLLQQVAKELAKISSEEERQNISGCTEILAGLRYDKDLIRQLFRGDIMQESVIYQDIIQTGRQQEALGLIKRQLSRRLGNIDSAILQRIESLSIQQLESLAEALLDFTTKEDLLIWLNQSN